MNMKIKSLVMLVFIFMANCVYADDWLDLVQQYTSADKINFAPTGWDSLVNEYSGKNGQKSSSKNILAQWWDTFEYETLTKLIEMAFANNKDIQSSRAKVEEARAQLGLTMSDLSPKVNGSTSWNHAEYSKNSSLAAAGHTDTYNIGLDASWEIDLWGKKQDNVNAWVSLSAEVARNYINLRTLQKRIEVANNNLEIQQDVFNLLKSQVDAGLKDELDLQQSKYTLERTKSSIPALKQSAEEIMNVLAILTGEVPVSLNALLNQNNSFIFIIRDFRS